MEIFPDPQNPAYIKNIKGKLCLVRRRPDCNLKDGRKAHSKSLSKDFLKANDLSSTSRESTSPPASRSSRSSSKHLYASVEDDTEDNKPKDEPLAASIDLPYEEVSGIFKKENIEKLREPLKKVGDAFTAANEYFQGDPTTKTGEQELEEKVAESLEKVTIVFASSLSKTGELFKGTSTTKKVQQETVKAKDTKIRNRPQKMADEKKDERKDDKKDGPDGMSKSDKTSTLPPGYPVQPGIYQYAGRTLALVPKGTSIGAAIANTGYVGGAYAPGTYGQFPMGGTMMAPPINMGLSMGAFGGFNSQHDKLVEVTNVNTTADGSPAWTAQHACAGCGRLRSKKFQQENPLEIGELPPISYCRKCEKEIKSTDDEDSDTERGRSKHKKHSKVRRTSRSSFGRKEKPQIVVQEFIVKKNRKKSKNNKKGRTFIEEESNPGVSKEAAAYLHICANCKNPRSKKYQTRHPIKKGETPPPAFCGKCQKEETSSEEESGESDESESEEDITHNLSQEGSSVTVDSRQYGSVPSVDGGAEKTFSTTRRHKHRASAPIKVVEEYSSSSDSANLMPPPPRPHRHKEHHSSKSTSNNKKTYDSKGDGVIVQHHLSKHGGHRSDNEKGRGRGGGGGSHSYHHRHERRSYYEVPSPLMKDSIGAQDAPVRRRSTRARSLDREERPATSSRATGASRHPSKPKKYFYTERGDAVSYDSEDDIEEIARDLYKTTLSDGAPMHEERRHYHHQNSQHHWGVGMSHSGSFNSTNSRFSDASQRRRRERSQSGNVHVGYIPPIHQETPHPEALLQRPPDEVIVTTERYVFKKPRETASATSRISSIHSEENTHGMHERDSNSSGTRSHKKLITHDDEAEYYPDSWVHRDSYGRKVSASLSSRQVMASSDEIRRPHRGQHYYKYRGHDDSSSIAPDAGSFLDTDSNRSQASHDHFHDERTINPIAMIRNKANTNTASIPTDRSSDTYTTSSGSYSSVYTGSGSSHERTHRSGNVTPKAFRGPVLPQVPGSYVSEEEVTTTVRTERDRGRNRERSSERHNESLRRHIERTRSNYHQPSVSDAPSSEYNTDSDHATAGHGRSRSKSTDRRGVPSKEGSEMTSNDHIERSISKKRRSRRVSFGEADRVHTYSQVSLGSTTPPNMSASPAPGISTEKLLDEIDEVRELEHRREIARLREERERGRELERREQRHRARREERAEEKLRRERARQKDHDYAYKSGRD